VGYAKVGGKKWLKVEGKDCRRKCKCVMGPKKSGKRGTKLRCTKRFYGKARKNSGRRNKRKSKRKGRGKKRRNRKRKKSKCRRKKSKSGSPTLNPTTIPTVSPTAPPTNAPTQNPTGSPTELPTNIPTLNPTTIPTVSPTAPPTNVPTQNPTRSPTELPTNIPTTNPTQKPSFLPTQNPTKPPTVRLIDRRKTGYVNDWDKTLKYEAGSNRVITGMYSVHDNGKEDRRSGFYTMRGSGFSCTPESWYTGYVNGWDKEFRYSCPSNHAMYGVYSKHDDGTEDRRFKFKCCRLSNARLRKTSWSGWQNTWDSKLDFQCKNDGILTGVYSKHSDQTEDRLFAFQCSNLY